MTINISDPQTLLIFGGLFFILIGLVNLKLNKGETNASFEAKKGRDKYLVIFGFIVLFIGVTVTLATINGPEPSTDDLSNDKSQIEQSSITSDYAPSIFITKTYETYEFEDYYTGMKGMVIHVALSTANLKNKRCILTAWFCDANGAPLKDTDLNYSISNCVAAYTYFTPQYTYQDFVDIPLFIPYTQFDITDPGNYTLGYYVSIADNDNILAKSDGRFFTYTQSE